MDRPLHFDKYGRPLSLQEWAALLEDRDYRRVGYTELPPTALVPEASFLSTTWLGLDHAFGPGPPILFETMRFLVATRTSTNPVTGERFAFHPEVEFPCPHDETERTEQVRYATEEQARLGHARIVRLIREHELT